MKITYHQNPLRTTVELDDKEKTELWYRIKVEQMEFIIHGAHIDLMDGKIDDAKNELNPNQLYCELGEPASKIDIRTNELYEHYLAALKDTHIGDCTCFAASCSKCHAESLMMIRTIPGLGKHEGSYIFGAFKDETKTLDQAIEDLGNFDANKGHDEWKNRDPEGFAKWVPVWNRQARSAHLWLTKYRATHFS